MVRKQVCVLAALAAILAICCIAPNAVPRGLAGDYRQASTDLFYNYYVPPSGGGTLGAELYLSPRPTPPLVGHTYVTYQPLMPHEFLYPHHRTYLRWHPDGSMTRTRVSWRPTLFNSAHHRSPLPSPPLSHPLHPLEPWHSNR